VNVLAACEITQTVPVNFGAQTALANNVDASGRVTVNCSNGTEYSIAIDDGLNAQGGQRYMRRIGGVSDLIEYELYQDPYTQRWGSVADERLEATGTGGDQLHLIYARVPAHPTPPPATYTDTVVITVHY